MIRFEVKGTPIPKGSTRAFVVKGRAVTTAANPRTYSWQSTVSAAAAEAMQGRQLLEGPVVLRCFFSFPRAKAHFLRDVLRDDAPQFPAKKPDLDKLVRLVADSLTGVVIHDDAQVVAVFAIKAYGDPGVVVHVEAM